MKHKPKPMYLPAYMLGGGTVCITLHDLNHLWDVNEWTIAASRHALKIFAKEQLVSRQHPF